jgi:hypothetical protein
MARASHFVLAAFAALFSLLAATHSFAQATFPSGPNPAAVTTYHSIGLYWFNPPNAGGAATVRFKEAGTPTWRDGLELWYDARNTEYRGSLVELKPGTTYDVELTLAGSPTTLQATTWSEKHPIGSTVIVPNGSTVFDVTTAMSGSASGYTLITAPPGQNVIVGGASPVYCMRIRNGVHHVIIRGLVFQDCARWGIFIEFGNTGAGTGPRDIVIENNEFVNWGSFGLDTNFPNDPTADGAVHCNSSGDAKPQRVTIQRNNIHDPRHGATPWGPSNIHPRGPYAVLFGSCGNNHVIRYNDVYSTTGRHFQDALGGCCNFSTAGFPFADADIYGNRISHVYDDAIESEGANRNVRIWANFIDRSFVAIANAAVVTGPLYVWRNVSNDMALMKDPTATADEGINTRGPFVKAGSNNASFNGGRAYYFHNTTLQPASQQSQLYPRGAGYGLNDSGGSSPFYNFVSLNNVWHIHKVPHESGGMIDYYSILANCSATNTPCTSNYDLFNGRVGSASDPGAPEVNGFGNPAAGDALSVPTYDAPVIPSAANGWAGDFRLAPSSLGYQGGTLINNFNDLANPDPGAHQSGTPPMVFGRTACFPYYSACRP